MAVSLELRNRVCVRDEVCVCQGDEVCVYQGKAEMTKSLELRNRKVWQSQYELYKEEHLKTPWMKRGTLRNEEKWCVSGVGCRV